VEGVLNIDKPQGLTSHDVVNQIRRLSGLRRVGHAGTLDPLATGVLLLCLGRATRLVEYMLGQRKKYEATIRLGQTTNTYDADGEIVVERPVNVSEETLVHALAHFRGSIQQQPPLFSAVKKGGQPLYQFARRGIDVERPLRDVTIYALELLEWSAPYLRLHVECSAGTYIRSLAHDLGETLDCGGHIVALRRTAVGNFTIGEAIRLRELTQDNLGLHLQPGDTAVAHLPRLDLAMVEAETLQQGRPLLSLASQSENTLARAYDSTGRFIGIVIHHEGFWQPRKMFLSP
jgi:tRNA pseudouridine55 synthase